MSFPRRHGWWVACGVAALGWSCTSFDLGKGRTYPCVPDASVDQCALGWVCGLEGVCHDGDAGGPFQCASTTPCTGGWQCGLEGVCHDPDAGAAYLCANVQGNLVSNPSDTYCAPGWLCTKSGRCAQPSAGEGRLVSFPPDASTQIDPVSPLALWQQPQAVAFSSPVDAGPSTWLQNAAFIDTNGLTILQRTIVTANGGAGTQDSYSLSQVPFAGTVSAMAATAGHLFLLTDAGLLALFPDGGLDELHPEVMAGQLRQQPLASNAGAANDMILAFDAGTYWTITEAAGALTVTAGQFPDGGTIVQMSGYAEFRSCIPQNGWAALDETGALYLAVWNGATFGLWHRQDWGLPADAGLLAQDVQVLGPGTLAAAFYDGAGNSSVGLWDISGCASNATLVPVLAPCAVCGGALGEIHPLLKPDGTAAVEARCLPAGNGPWGPVRVEADPFGGQCRTFPVPQLTENTQLDDLLPAPALPAVAGYAGSHGQLEFGPTLATADAFTLDQVPGALMGHGGQLLASSSGASFASMPGMGLVRTRSQLTPSEVLVSAVEGWPYWGVFADGTVKVVLDSDSDASDGDFDFALPWTLAQLDPTIAQFQAPFTAAVRDSGGGSSVVVVAAGDALLATDTVNANFFTPSVLQVKAVPAPGSAITSIALLPGVADGTGTSSISGYVLAQGAVYSFQGPSDGPVWTSARIDTGVPVEDAPGEASNNLVSAPLKVFAADTAAWLGLQDGAVYSLPHLIRAAPSFLQQGLKPPGNIPVWTAAAIDYGQVCGVTYVATVNGAYRLQPPAPGQRLGFWTPEPGFKGGLAPRDPTLNSFTGLNPSRFYGALDELYWVSAFGAVARLKVLGCPP